MPPLSYSGYRFPREIIQRAVWMYLRFTLSFRDVEELLAERGITVSHESIRRGVVTLWAMDAISCGSIHVRRRHRQHSAMTQTPRLERAGAYELKRDGGER